MRSAANYSTSFIVSRNLSNGNVRDESKANIQLRRARKAVPGLTLDKLAEMTGISQSQLSRFESGKRKPRVADMMKIGEALKVSFESPVRPRADPTRDQTPNPMTPPADQRLEALSWMLEAAFEALGMPSGEAGFLAASLLEAVAGLEFGPQERCDQARARDLAASLVAAIAPRQRR
jgi:transcriptional regulator with XRE-family HTH domain